MSTDITAIQNKLRPSLIAESIRFMRNTNVSLYVHGAPGISKSAVCKQTADGFGIAFIDFRLTSVAPEDIRGVPHLSDVGGMTGMVWTPPLVYPRDLDLAGTVTAKTKVVRFYNPIGDNDIHYCKKPEITVTCLDEHKTAHIVDQQLDRFTVVVKDVNGRIVEGEVLWTVTGKSEAILGLEEFNSASLNVMAAAYQLILDRRIGDYIVPHGVMIVAMGNRDGDKGVTHKIPKPVANRFDHLEMEINSDDWQIWAVQNDIHPDVVGYLAKWTSHLFDVDFADHPEHSFYTPRTWEFVSKIISAPGAETMDKVVLRALICGAIGNVVGTTFLMHREFMADMPNVQDIFSGKVTTLETKSDNKYKTQIAYSICVQMCYALNKESVIVDRMYKGNRLEIDNSPERKEWAEKADNAIGYAMANFTPEVMIVFQRMAVQLYKLRLNGKGMKNFKLFARENKDMIF